jgi:hypothetical protein
VSFATLAAGAQMECTASGTATLGQYENTGRVVGTDPAGTRLFDTDPSHYFGVVSRIDVKKFTNGEDADVPTGPVVSVGGAVTWTYVVRNTGNVPISVAVGGDCGVVPELGGRRRRAARPRDVDVLGDRHRHGGTVREHGDGHRLDVLEHRVSDSDPSHYFGPPPVFPSPAAVRAQPPSQPPRRRRRQAHRHLSKRASHSRAGGHHGAVHAAGAQHERTISAHRVRVCDLLPSGLTYASARGARIVGRSACFNAGTVPARQTRTFAVAARADATARPRRICNVAVRTASGLSARRVRECVRILPIPEQRPGGVTG